MSSIYDKQRKLLCILDCLEVGPAHRLKINCAPGMVKSKVETAGGAHL